MISEPLLFCPGLKCHLFLITYRGLLSLNLRNVVALAFKPPPILIHMHTCVKGRSGGSTQTDSCQLLSPFSWKINDHAEHVDGKQTSGVIKAPVVTCECGWVGRWEAALSPRPLERCPHLSGLVSVVVCLFVFLCGHTRTHLVHKSDMKRLSDILQFTLFFWA